MDTYETLNCKKNKFDSKKKFGILTNLESDKCNMDKDEIQSMKPLKHFTRNFFDKKIIQDRGINFQDGFGTPSCKIDHSTNMRFGTSTNLNLPLNLPALPLPTTASYVKGQGPVSVEQRIRPRQTKELKSCNPRDTEYYKRHFYIFDHLSVTPNGCVDNVVQNGPAFRQGVPTRFVKTRKYKK